MILYILGFILAMWLVSKAIPEYVTFIVWLPGALWQAFKALIYRLLTWNWK